nr:nonribosomal peptide synthetase fmpe [Quercus suber]
MLQFSDYVFDISVCEIFATLLFGGCLCVPSDEDRLSNMAGFIELAQVNSAMLTPSLAATLDPAQVPSLRTLLLVGEAPTKTAISTWANHVQLINDYGPAEACIFVTSHELHPGAMSARTIGRGCNNNLWIVDPNDHNHLAPVGCTGELLIQGPGLAREYLNDPEKTARAFIHPPSWLPTGPFTRLYKTGDLVQYNDDGTIDYVGRKDGQIKIRGQRIEPGEVEHHVKKLLPIALQVIVTFGSSPSRSSLIAFVSINPPQTNGGECTILKTTQGMHRTFVELADSLAGQLPAYMIPAYYVPVTNVPITTSGKSNRKLLHEMLANMTAEDIIPYSIEEVRRFRVPENEIQVGMRSLWAQVLNIEETNISIDDNFYQLGGDSIKIVTLVELIKRQHGVSLGRNLLHSNRMTIHETASFLTNAEAAEAGVTCPEIDLTAEFNESWKHVRFPGVAPDHGWATTLPPNANVFVTGATGYLGTQILKQLMKHSYVNKVIVLVRANDVSQAFAKLEYSAYLAGWWKEDYRHKIQVWTGDLGRLGFGLNEEQWKMLSGRTSCERIDAIIHNGAAVEWNTDYSTLRPANVDSTVQLLNVMLSSPACPKMIYISGGVKLDESDRKAVGESLSRATGYSQTKFLSEALVRECTRCLPAAQNVLSIVKPGLIIGSPEHGVANADDFIWRLVAGAARIGAYPSEIPQHWIFISDVDTVTQAIIAQLTLGTPSAFVDIDIGISVSAFWRTVEAALPSPVQSVSWEQWMSMADLDLARVGQMHPLWPVQRFLGQLGTARQPSQAMAAQETVRVEAALKQNVAYLLNARLIYHDRTETDAIFTRSRGRAHASRAAPELRRQS